MLTQKSASASPVVFITFGEVSVVVSGSKVLPQMPQILGGECFVPLPTIAITLFKGISNLCGFTHAKKSVDLFTLALL